MKDLLLFIEVLRDWMLMLLPYFIISITICFTPVFTVGKKKVGLCSYIMAMML